MSKRERETKKVRGRGYLKYSSSHNDQSAGGLWKNV